MKRAKIYFQTTPFEGLIKSAYETLRVECQGSLFGRRNPKTLEWFIESILPSQLVDRKPDGVYFINKLAAPREEAELIKEKIGEYHSHTMFRKDHAKKVCMSKFDAEMLKQRKDEIEIIIGVKKAKITTLPNNPFLATCYIRNKGNLYRFDIGGYHYSGKLRRAEIIVPEKVIREFGV